MTYRVRQGAPYLIDTVSYEFRDKFLEQILAPDTANTLVRPGRIFDITMLDSERERITAYLKERGYYNFSVNNIEFVADTLSADHRVGVRIVVKQHLTGYDERGQAVMDNNMVYRIERINIFPDYDPLAIRSDSTLVSRLDTLYYRGLNVIYEGKPNLRPSILRQAVPLYPNYVYNSAQVDRTYTDLMAMGYFRSARIAFVEQPQTVDVTNYVSYIGATADSTRTDYTQEGYLTCNILCTPMLKQSFKIELEGSTTSSFYGLKATAGYQNRNIFRGAESFDVSFTGGYEFMKARDAKEARHRVRCHGRTDLSPLLSAVAHAALPFGQPAQNQGRALHQLPGPPLLPANAVECGMDLSVDQFALFVVLAAAHRHQCGRRELSEQ